MKIKQKKFQLLYALMFSLGLSGLITTSSYALTISEFKAVLCGGYTNQEQASCEDEINGSKGLEKKWYGEQISFTDWKNKSKSELEKYRGEQLSSQTVKAKKSGSGCGGVETAIIKCSQNNKGDDIENNGVWALLIMAINIMTAGVGVLAVGGIVYGAVLYTTAEDKADQVSKGIDTIRNVIVGLIAFALMWALLQYLIPGGVFGS